VQDLAKIEFFSKDYSDETNIYYTLCQILKAILPRKEEFIRFFHTDLSLFPTACLIFQFQRHNPAGIIIIKRLTDFSDLILYFIGSKNKKQQLQS
jgi:hypothetical protein